MDYPFRNLVLAGGGIWGIAYAGVARALTQQGIYGNVERLAGVSVGAIFATLIAVGYSADEIDEIISETDFRKFRDKPNALRVLTRYGFYRGEYSLDWMRACIDRSPGASGHPHITFGELQDLRDRPELYVFAVDLNTQTYQEFSARTTPRVQVAEAVRASMSLPIVFEAWTFPTAPDRHIYTDGGMMNNYPISFFDDPAFSTHGELANEQTLGFMFATPQKSVPHHHEDGLGYGNLEAYVKALIKAILLGVEESLRNPSIMERTVLLDTPSSGVSPVEFGLSRREAEDLVQIGFDATTQFLRSYRAP